MLDAQHRTVRDALREEMRPLVLGRMRRVLYIGVIGLVLSALSDLRLGPAVPRDLVFLKLGGSLVEGAAIVLLALVRRSSWQRSMAGAVAAWSIAGSVVSVIGSYTGDPMMPTLLLPVMVVGAAMVFPWGTVPQLALVAIASLIFLPHVPAWGTNLIVSVYSVFAASAYVAATFERHHLERKAIELLQAGQQRGLERIAADAPLPDVFAELLDTVAQQAPELLCALMLLDRETNELRCVASVGLPDDYRRTVERVGGGMDMECCAAARSGTRMITANIATDPRGEPVRPVALAHGLRSSWAEPIHAADRSVVGIIAVYRREPHVPDRRELRLVEAAARLAGIAIERREARVQLERYLQALDGARIRAEEQAHQLQEQAVQLAEARDQALASARARSQFLANMSHEIRTPLNGIIGTTDILLDSDLDATQRDYAQILSRCGQHLLGVIDDVLDLAKIEAGKVEIEHVELDLRALVEEIAGVLAARAQDKGIELATAITPDLDATVKGDPSRLRQVLVNLVGNAIKFTERGSVVIKVRVLRASDTQLTVRLAVRDTGIGISPERRDAVFESFTQADGSTTRNYGGTGLGLTICRELVHLMGGEINLRSTPGKGSTFWIDLPLERVPPGRATRRAAPVRLAGLHVLVVDDTAINRLILRRSLQGWGCRVEESAGGVEALTRLTDALGRDPFALVILDLHMPEVDGLETARRIRMNPGLAGVPLILLSSIGGLRGGDREVRESGLAAVVIKPIRQSALLDALLGALGESRSAPAAGAHAAAPAGRPLALRVLVAEDNHVNQLVAQRLLEKLGCHADVAESGREAVEAVARTRYDVVLMDIQMPVMDGFEATALIRSREAAGEHVSIIAMTAHAMQGDRERCLAAGMDGYITKPVGAAALQNVLAGLRPYATVAATPQAPAPGRRDAAA
jgi:signal transduction histidine kinase/DNA-binding response OmpR family regulator